MSFVIEILQLALAISLSFLGMDYERQEPEDTVQFQPAESETRWQHEAAVFQDMIVWVDAADAPLVAPAAAPAPRPVSLARADSNSECEDTHSSAAERVISHTAI